MWCASGRGTHFALFSHATPMFELNLLHTCLERVGQPQRLVRGTENYVFSLVVFPRKLQNYLCCTTLLYYFAAIHTLLYSCSTGIMFYFCRQCFWTIPLPCGLSGLRGKKTETKIWEPIYDTDRSRRGRPNFKGRALSVRWTESANLDSQQEGVRGISAYL